VSKIGSDSAQEFYRTLAADLNIQAREEAAIHLADVNTATVEKNLPILRQLLTDPIDSVQMRAAVSLLLLGQDNVQPTILGWLTSGKTGQKPEILPLLDRVVNGVQL
jgi:HEAT repeat protein